MKDRILLFFRTYLFWILFFVISRVVFLFYHLDKSATLTAKDIGKVILLGLRMDAAMAGYWCILTGLLLTASVFIVGNGIRIIQMIITIVLLFVSSLIVVSDLELYRHWGFRMDTTPLMYVGSEGAQSVGAVVAVKLLFIFAILFISSFWLFNKTVTPHFRKLEKISMAWALGMLVASGLLFIPIRSGFGVAPLNSGMVYFHRTNAFANHAGINAVWNFFKSLTSDNKLQYSKKIYNSDTASSELNVMMHTAQPGFQLTTLDRPNVLLIIMESFTAKIIEPLGGRAGITPNINQLVKEGILFDRFYASGDRTDKGIISILSSYPAQPRTSIIKYPGKTQSLPFLPVEMEKSGYHTSFVYGGNIGFANMESYLTMAGFSNITEDDDFPSEFDNSKWGVHDHFVFECLQHECDSAIAPFFKTVLTLSSHEPFDVPTYPRLIEGADEASLFLNACKYADQSLGDFIKAAKTKPWWNNTLVIITADHGHRFPNQDELKEKERFHIPLLILGGALTKKDTIIHTIGSQTDIGTTLLNQIGKTEHVFPFGKNILAPDVKPGAVYVFNNGFGYIDNQNEFIYDFDFKNYIKQTGPDGEKKWGEAYMQSLFTDYNKR